VRESGDAFHLAIPAYDLAEAEHFYVQLLGCKLARRYQDRITLDFFGDQLVCHLTPRPADAGGDLDLYPRHFGVTFRQVPVFRDVDTRFDGKPEVHRTFVLRDPSDNLVEFKHYADPRMMY
jgi:extradiol dioxygenase family protein